MTVVYDLLKPSGREGAGGATGTEGGTGEDTGKENLKLQLAQGVMPTKEGAAARRGGVFIDKEYDAGRNAQVATSVNGQHHFVGAGEGMVMGPDFQLAKQATLALYAAGGFEVKEMHDSECHSVELKVDVACMTTVMYRR